ncbi:zinc-binding dehydrogenase [Actinoplanes sp. NBRC 101535]|uniref:zinc-binding dehydrogenase n=1 Tax=Actinoplanes sp. NBRC 101535 TaxID=3032196 RepID=UPI0025537047|nr:zinc-binding dehydrogenase [Actinoplanes sp. NBRC 101535]
MVQLAKWAGAHLTATAGLSSIERVRRLGAARVIDYTSVSLVSALSGMIEPVDVVINVVAASEAEMLALFERLRNGGALVSATTPVPPVAAQRGVRAARMASRSDAAQLATLVRLEEGGQLEVFISDQRPLTELPEVHELAETGKLHGKTIFVP